MDNISIILPDDWHLHLRDNQALKTTVPAAARGFGRGVIMPNLTPPVTQVADAAAYRERIMAQRPKGSTWEPLMVLYLTDNTTADEIRAAKDCGFIHGCKYYPAGATTNSASGVTDLSKMSPVFEAMQDVGMVLQLHGEVTSANIDIFDREAVFIDRHLRGMAQQFPDLKIVLEHITTQQGADFVLEANDNVAASITPQHLLYNRNHMLVGGIRPHLFCLPILKRDTHQQALVNAATSGNTKFFLGTDSAPHAQGAKESACGCAGCFSHHAAIELYAEVFGQAGAMDKLEAFASTNGPDFYGLPRNSSSIVLKKQQWQLPDSLPFEDTQIIPLGAGTTLNWKIVE
ncbi:MAG: dihydroorotase [Porticoccaceae bacterium]|jgi:dihydroorotase|nr:dihydroorotase [Porticoccaceae bacterium]MBT5103874.1 dihydroorotase [Porticoccaceae bacterium]MBT6028053.1 dihydroorotase [Porticoccaceae bacterium]MBT6693310.1 dihydroorotase [Porticoccaceae bacterium]MBT6799500.1 dihydroorotase [Porticoccaceae bacterium]